jgi:hypothetical protein
MTGRPPIGMFGPPHKELRVVAPPLERLMVDPRGIPGMVRLPPEHLRVAGYPNGWSPLVFNFFF